MWHWGYDAWWMGLMMLVFWTAIIGLVVWSVRSRSEGGPRPDSSKTALDILAERYARGEIDEEEYRLRRATIQASDATA